MKNKILSWILSVALIVPCVLVFSACGKDEKERPQRQSELSIVHVYQDAGGSLLAELSGFMYPKGQAGESEDAQSSILEFSFDEGQTWKREGPIAGVYTATGKGVYSLLLSDHDEDNVLTGFRFDTADDAKTCNIGDEIHIWVRMPEDIKYSASEPVKYPSTYTLKGGKLDFLYDLSESVIVDTEAKKLTVSNEQANNLEYKVIGKNQYPNLSEIEISFSEDYAIIDNWKSVSGEVRYTAEDIRNDNKVFILFRRKAHGDNLISHVRIIIIDAVSGDVSQY